MENKRQQAVIEYDAPRPVRIGDVFYKIERGKWIYFREPCPVCKDERKLTVNGHTFDCPVCRTLSTTINVSPFFVRRYRVDKIEQESPSNNWKASPDRYVTFHFYRKDGRGYQWSEYSSFEMRSDEFCRLYNKEYDGEPFSEHFNASGIYDNYNVAISIAEQMTRQELRRLAEYNAKFGTSYKVDFEADHDPKSN